MKTSTDIEKADSSRRNAYTGTELPNEAKDLSDSELRRRRKSSTDTENAKSNRSKPCTDTMLPKAADNRSDSAPEHHTTTRNRARA